VKQDCGTESTKIREETEGKRKKHGGEERWTLRGLTTGSVEIRKETAQVECLLVYHTCPSWIFVLTELGLAPRSVLLTDPTY
jgi:hypothetical protein